MRVWRGRLSCYTGSSCRLFVAVLSVNLDLCFVRRTNDSDWTAAARQDQCQCCKQSSSLSHVRWQCGQLDPGSPHDQDITLTLTCPLSKHEYINIDTKTLKSGCKVWMWCLYGCGGDWDRWTVSWSHLAATSDNISVSSSAQSTTNSDSYSTLHRLLVCERPENNSAPSIYTVINTWLKTSLLQARTAATWARAPCPAAAPTAALCTRLQVCAQNIFTVS